MSAGVSFASVFSVTAPPVDSCTTSSVDSRSAVTVSGDVEVEGALAGDSQHRIETVSGELTLGAVGGLVLERTRLSPEGVFEGTGEFETLEADSLVLAVGQETDTTFLRSVAGIEFTSDGAVVVGEDMQTGHPGGFAGGDMVPYERTVTPAVGHGKAAARHIDAYLTGEGERSFAASEERSGPILLAQLSEGGESGANSIERCSSVRSFTNWYCA